MQATNGQEVVKCGNDLVFIPFDSSGRRCVAEVSRPFHYSHHALACPPLQSHDLCEAASRPVSGNHRQLP